MSVQLSFIVRDEEEMETAAAVFATHSQAPLDLGLQGGLGSGKTVFCRGYIQACGHRGIVRSPTYTLVETYTGKNFCIYHFDFYRLQKDSDFEMVGGRDYMDDNSVRLFEWCDRLEMRLDLSITIDILSSRRRLTIKTHSVKGEQLVQAAVEHLTLIAPQWLKHSDS